MRTTIGRIVFYRPTKAQREAFPMRDQAKVVPAIIVFVGEYDALDLHVFPPGESSYYVRSSCPGTDEGDWDWPIISPAVRP